jgi:uncharacterized protein with NRDE domain
VCTLIILNEQVPDHPLIVAANRDERYGRKSRPPDQVTKANLVTLIMPHDDERGGTWMGVDQTGWFVGITNQDDGHHDEHKKSRGDVVLRVLGAGNHTIAARVLASLDPEDYNPFNLVFGRAGALFLTRVLPGQHIEMEPIPKGINVISNDCWGDRYAEKTDWAKRMAWSLTDDPPVDGIENIKARLLITLASHFSTRKAKDDPFQALCVHADEYAFGTRSTSLITVSNQGVVEYWYKEGPACQQTPLTLAGRLLHLDFSDLEPIELKDEDIEVIG